MLVTITSSKCETSYKSLSLFIFLLESGLFHTEMTTEDLNRKRLDSLVRHITNVQNNCTILGERLIDKGEVDFGRRLIANGFIHDHSKFGGIEWQYLHGDVKETEPDKFFLAADQHVRVNKHHPEYWLTIHEMPRIYVSEMVCDWAARSSEFGNNPREWCKDKATKKFNFSCQSKVYKEIKFFMDMLLDPAFK